MNKRYQQKHRLAIIVLYFSMFIGLLMLNFITFQSYQKDGIETIVPFDSLVFLLIGIALLGISCFSVLQLYQYKIGKIFSIYVLLIGLALGLAPCNQINEVAVTFMRAVFTYGSSLLLFQVIGYLTLLINKKLFQVFQGILVCSVIAGIVAQILVRFPLKSMWIYIFATESIHGSICLSALFCLMVMTTNYKKSNAYAKKQCKVLLLGIGIGIVLFLLGSVAPNIYMISNGQAETETYIELAMIPNETVAVSVPLLLFAGVSVSIIFMLIHRGFVFYDMRLKLGHFVIVPLYVGVVNILLFAYANCPLWLLFLITILLFVPFLLNIHKIFQPIKSAEEQTYQRRLMEEVEREKQEISSYLHDEVLQSLIAFYRQVQADETRQYVGMKMALSNLISQIRHVSHNLYPTMVEDLGLEQSLYIFTDELKKSYSMIKINYQYMLTDGILPKSFALAFYRISKELVTNAAKHSGGSQIFLLLEEDNEGYYIHIQDNGNGFELPKNGELLQAPHMGIYTVKKQVLGLQGQMSFESNPHTGTSYHIYFPKKEEAENES